MFRSFDQNSQMVSLADYTGDKNIVLYFYPKDDTPGCTIEANDFTRLADEFAKLDTVVIGVSKDTCASHAEFINKYGLKVTLLADTTGAMCEDYGVWREREKNGIKSMAILRSTFIIDKNGVLAEVYYGVNHEGHAEAVLQHVNEMLNPPSDAESLAEQQTEQGAAE